MDHIISSRLADLTRRGVLGSLTAAGVGFAFFGPRGTKDNRDGRLVLDYWEKWTGQEGAAMQGIVDRFNQSQSKLFVRYFTISEIDKKGAIAIAGGAPPDLIGLYAYNIPGYAESNAILPLNDLARSAGIRQENYALAVRELVEHQGKQWGVANTCGSVGLYYNKAIFRERGLDPERPPRTIAELDEMARALTITGPDGRLSRVGFVHTEPGWWSWDWGHFFGGSLYDLDTDSATATAAANIAAFDWVQSYGKNYGVDKLLGLQSGLGVYSSAEQGFLSGRVAMVAQGPWLANIIKRFTPDLDYGAAPMPVIDSLYDPTQPVALIESDVLVIPRGARNPEASMEFIAFTQRRENVEELSRIHCKASTLATSTPEFFATHPNRCVAMHDQLAKSPRAFTSPRTRVWLEFKDEMESGFQKLWRLEEPAKAVLQRVQDRAQLLLADAARQRNARAALRAKV